MRVCVSVSLCACTCACVCVWVCIEDNGYKLCIWDVCTYIGPVFSSVTYLVMFLQSNYFNF
jgi:hypothetical protein